MKPKHIKEFSENMKEIIRQVNDIREIHKTHMGDIRNMIDKTKKEIE